MRAVEDNLPYIRYHGKYHYLFYYHYGTKKWEKKLFKDPGECIRVYHDFFYILSKGLERGLPGYQASISPKEINLYGEHRIRMKKANLTDISVPLLGKAQTLSLKQRVLEVLQKEDTWKELK